jgi:uncharacterized protein DUF6491
MLSRLLRHAAAASLAGVVVACAGTHGAAGAPAATASLPGTPDCFWLRNVYDWTVLNNSELIVHVPLAQDGYLVKLFQPVFDLDFHLGLGFEDVEHTGRICGPSRDNLLVPNYTPRSIPIVAVQRLSAAEQVQLLRAAKKPVPRVLLKPQPAGPT